MAERILLVDDDEGFLLAAGRLLEAAGYDITRATSAAEARGELEAGLPDLILLDVIMPEQDGFSFADEVAKNDNLADIPVVLVTAVAENAGQMMHAFETGQGLPAADILPKSMAHTDLVKTVAAVLGKS